MTFNASVTYRARWVFPISVPPIQDGAVRVEDGRIVSVKKYRPGEVVTDLGNVALLPCLINAHTHLEFSLLEQPLGREGMRFADWIGEVVAFRRRVAEAGVDMAAYAAEAIAAGLEESFDAGVVGVGEIAGANCPIGMFDSSKVGGIVFLELLGLAPNRTGPLLAAALQHLDQSPASNFRRGLSPHAPYTVSLDLLGEVCKLSTRHQTPLAMHLAESMEELELLRSHSGPLVERLKELGAWFPGQIPRGIRPNNYLELLASAPQSLVIHGNFLGLEEMDFLAARREKMSVIYCPRTHAFFRHGAYPLEEFLRRGVRVAVGTDSRASNPDLSVLAELRQIAQHHPTIDPEDILKMGTIHGVEALGMADVSGSLRAGQAATLAVVPLPAAGEDPYEFLYCGDAQSKVLPSRVP